MLIDLTTKEVELISEAIDSLEDQYDMYNKTGQNLKELHALQTKIQIALLKEKE